MTNQIIIPSVQLKQKPILLSYMEVLAFVLVYIVVGFLLKLNPNQYLLLGIPMAIIFQIFIRKQPLYRAWVRDEINFSLSKSGMILFIILMALPAYKFFQKLIEGQLNLTSATYLIAACIGALGAANSYSRFNIKTLKDLLLCLLVAGCIASLICLLPHLLKRLNGTPIHFNLLTCIESMLLYIPVTFIMEEVIFRGILYNHVVRYNNKYDIWSAVFVSVLWGLWHLPVTMAKGDSVIALSIGLVVVQLLVGIPLSLYFKRSGNLGVPAFTHAFADAIRNALNKV